MKATHTFGIDFIIRTNKNNKTSALIFARITVNGERKEISLKENIETASWDASAEIVRGRTEKIRAVNKHIEDVRYRIKEKYKHFEEKDCVITAELLKEAYLGNHIPKKTAHTIFELTKFHCKIEADKLKQGTLKNYVATEEYLKRFIRYKFDVDDISLEKIDYSFLTELEYYIRNNPLKKQSVLWKWCDEAFGTCKENDQMGKKIELDKQ